MPWLTCCGYAGKGTQPPSVIIVLPWNWVAGFMLVVHLGKYLDKMEAASPVLDRLLAWQAEWKDTMSGFTPLLEQQEVLDDRVPEAFRDEFIALTGDPEGGIFALWVIAESDALDDQPIVWFEPESVPVVIATDLPVFLQMMAYGPALPGLIREFDDILYEDNDDPLSHRDTAYFDSVLAKALAEHPDLAAFHKQLKEELGIEPAADPFHDILDAIETYPDPEFGDEESGDA